MQSLLEIVLDAGKSAVELTLFLLLPVLVVMMALMRVLDVKGVLAWVARLLTPVLRPFGIPGVGVFAMLQMLLVSYAAPATTLAVMEDRGVSRRGLAATLAMVLTLSQANASFPLVAVGLSLPLILLTSLVGGFSAAAATYYLFLRTDDEQPHETSLEAAEPAEPEPSGRFVAILLQGGEQGVRLSLQAIPALLLALFALKGLAAAGAIELLERALSPLLNVMGLPGVAVLPLATKYLAGGTAMLAVTTDLIDEGALTVTDLNRLAGFMINPFDLVGLAVLCPAGTRLAAVARPAMLGAAVGILIRGILHMVFG